MGADQLIEERPEMNHGFAQILGACLAAAMTDDDLAAGAVVVQDRRVLDGEVLEPVGRILNRVATRTHDIFDESICLIHGSTWVIDESRLNRSPGLCILIRFVTGQRPQRERLHATLALHELALGFRRCLGRLQKAVVFRTETLSQDRCLASPDEQPHADCYQGRNDYDGEPYLRLLIHCCHLVHFGSNGCGSKRGAVSLCFLR